MGQVVAGMGEFDFDVLEKLLGIIASYVVEMRFGEFFGVTPAAFGFVKTTEGGEMNMDVEAVGRRGGAKFADVAH